MSKVIITVEDVDTDDGLVTFGTEIIGDEENSSAVVVAGAMAEKALSIMNEIKGH